MCDSNVGPVWHQWDFCLSSKVVIGNRKCETQIFCITLVGFQEHDVVVQLRIHGAQIGQHVEIIVVSPQMGQEEMSKLRMNGDTFVQGFSENATKEFEQYNVVRTMCCCGCWAWIHAIRCPFITTW
jgi:hypothetical protein